MKRPAIDKLVYDHMMQKPKPSDPENFSGILTRYLVFEVRQEVHSFYGHLDTPEAKYPGLDYCNPIHRIRLSRWQWHRRLFRAFDALQLTPGEINNLTKWEGTRWAKERYEKEQGITIEDTAAEGMPDYRHCKSSKDEKENDANTENWIDNQPTYGMNFNIAMLARSHPAMVYARRQQLAEECPAGTTASPATTGAATPASTTTSLTRAGLQPGLQPNAPPFNLGINLDLDLSAHGNGNGNQLENQIEIPDDDEDEAMNDVDGGSQEDSDDSIVSQSIGLQLNERLRERVAAHNAGDTSQPLDEDWEQWLKNALETGNLNVVASHTDLPFVHSQYSTQATSTIRGGNTVNLSSIPSPPTSNSGGDNGLTFSSIYPSQVLHSARQGNWGEVPEFLHDVLRQTIQAEAYSDSMPELIEVNPSNLATVAPSSSSTGRTRERTSPWRRTYSNLRLPGQ